MSAVRCLVSDLILSCLILAGLAFSYPLSLPFLASIPNIHSQLLSAVGTW